MTVERIGLAAVVAAMVAPPLYVGLRALGLPGAGAGAITLLALGAGTPFLARRLPPRIDAAWKRRRGLVLLWLLIGVVSVVQLARLGIFTLDSTRREHSMLPFYDTIAGHSCLTAYHRAALLVRTAEDDLYEPAHYAGTVRERRPGATAFGVEAYEYPPPFLLLARPLALVTAEDFFRLRALWYPLLALPVMLALGLLARWIDRGGPAALLAPAVLAAMPTMLGLQYGNFHLGAVALAVLGMLALRAGGRWPIAGGALLGFAVTSKIFPGLLLVPLLVERRWRALGWAAAWILIWLLLSMAVLGPAPMVAFLEHQVARLASGEAFPFMDDNERVVAANMSVHALAWKVSLLLGGQGSMLAGRVLTWLFAAALLAGLALAAARKSRGDRLGDAQLWLAALFLGALVSPFAPNPYAQFALLWLLTLLVPQSLATRGRVLLLSAGWLASSLMVHALPLPAGPALVGLSLVGQLLGIGVAGWVIARAVRRRPPVAAA
jgi:hypothetical protein